MTIAQQEEAAQLKRAGLRREEIAQRMNLSFRQVKSRLSAYRLRVRLLENASEGQKAAIEASGLDIGSAKHGWRVVQHEDGSRDSVFWKADAQEQEDMIERIRAAFEDLPAAEPTPAPPHKVKDLLTLYPIADAHIGMLAWGVETGEDYDTKKATQRLINCLGQAVEASAPSETAIILDVGDLTHADDHTNQTPASKHVLDVDSRHYRTIDVTITTLVTSIKLALRKHKKVIVRILPGNHNRESYVAIMFALYEHFRNEPRVTVEKQPGKYFTYQFGKNMICAHHGDGVKAERLVNFLADTYAPIWGQTQHRFLWTGHLHHHKSADIGGMQWEQLRALTAKDAYAVGHAYCARAQLQAVTYHKEKGEVGRVKVTA